jgi:hypothetical protein
MFFALYDYIQYRKRSGRYEKDINKSGSLMGRAYDGELPDSVFSKLRPGDIIFTAEFGWWVSWLIMYLTSSNVSHVAWYMGNRTIIHATLEGIIRAPVESLYSPDTRLLPCLWFIPDEKRKDIEPYIMENKERFYYDKILVLKKGLYIILGRDWSLFRWKFFFDISLFFILLDLVVFYLIEFPIFSFLSAAYLVLLIINRIIWIKRPVHVPYPEEFLVGLFSTVRGIPLLDVSSPDHHSEDEG